MGNTWIVLAWRKGIDNEGYANYEEYRGESMFEAVECAIRLKAEGVGSVTIKWN